MAGGTISFFTDMVQQIAERGRSLVAGARARPRTAAELADLAEELLSGAGEASSVARAGDLLDAYAAAPPEMRRAFLKLLASRFGPVEERIAHAMAAYAQAPGPRTAMALHLAAEPRRQDLFRKLNRAPGGTHALVRMREERARGHARGAGARRRRRRLPPPVLILVQPRLPRPAADRLDLAGERAGEDRGLRGGAPHRQLRGPQGPPRPAGPAALRLLPSGAWSTSR